MARKGGKSEAPPPEEHIVDIDVTSEMRESFLEYAYSVIFARALPDARDGLKPVQRRILYQMAQMGLRPDRGHVKSARVVGEVMGRLHPHGDSAIYDALVRMSQSFSLRLPMIDGHGNFGSLDDGPAAMRYTECRLAHPALDMTASLDEDVVDFRANYDGREVEPEVLPSAIPNLLVNGASGIAVGMATNLAPHNLGEVIAAARHLLAHPDAQTDDLMAHLPGPDLPSGGMIVGLDGVREAYRTGRGSFKMRATARIEQLTPRRKGIVITELPYNVGPERVIERIRTLVQAKKLQGIADLVDLTDGQHGLRLELTIKNGFHPEAVLAQLYKGTPLEEQFSINAVALVDGQPRILTLLQALQVFLDHRIEVTRRRSQHRRDKAAERLHLVEGLLIAILDIDEVIQLIRSSDDAAAARARLMEVFDLTEPQANYILDMPLRRLTKYSRIELEAERDELRSTIEDLDDILGNEQRLRQVVSDELAEVAARHHSPRRTVLLESDGAALPEEVPLEVPDAPCRVLLSSSGLLARTSGMAPVPDAGDRVAHDVLVASAETTARGQVGLVTSSGAVHRLSVLELPAIPDSAQRPGLSGGAPIGALVDLPRDEQVVGLLPLDGSSGLLLGTAAGVVKRVTADVPASLDRWEVISLADGDRVLAAVPAPADAAADDASAVFVTDQAKVLVFPASTVRGQGRAASGVAGIKLPAGARAIAFARIPAESAGWLLTVAGSSGALPEASATAAKLTPLAAYPSQGRSTGGVRCMRFHKGEDCLVLAAAGVGRAVAATGSGSPVAPPEPDDRRDGPGTPVSTAIAAAGGAVV